MNTVYILWLRQLKRYARSRPRMIGSLGQPLIFLLAFGFGFGHIYQKAGGGDYFQFLAPGLVLFAHGSLTYYTCREWPACGELVVNEASDEKVRCSGAI